MEQASSEQVSAQMHTGAGSAHLAGTSLGICQEVRWSVAHEQTADTHSVPPSMSASQHRLSADCWQLAARTARSCSIALFWHPQQVHRSSANLAGGCGAISVLLCSRLLGVAWASGAKATPGTRCGGPWHSLRATALSS